MSLAEFLLARIAEDEAVARDFGADAPGAIPDSELWITEADHPAISITAARVLAECEAKRQIVAALVALRPGGDDLGQGARWALTRAAKSLALPYADHPDYDEAWRP